MKWDKTQGSGDPVGKTDIITEILYKALKESEKYWNHFFKAIPEYPNCHCIIPFYLTRKNNGI